MAMEEDPSELSGEMIGKIDHCINPFKFEEIPFNPFAEGMIFNIHMLCAGCRCWGYIIS